MSCNDVSWSPLTNETHKWMRVVHDQTNVNDNVLSLQWKGYRAFACLGLVLLALAFAGSLLAARWVVGFMLAVLLVPTLYVIAYRHKRLPPLLQAVFVAAMLCNAAGYLFNWLAAWAPFDKIAHFYSGFALTFAFAFIVYSPLLPALRAHALLLWLAVTTLGISIASLWEVAEWLAEIVTGDSIIRSVADTVVDIVMGTIGAVLAAFLTTWLTVSRGGEILQSRSARSGNTSAID